MPRHPRRRVLAALAGDGRCIALDSAAIDFALEPRRLLGKGRADHQDGDRCHERCEDQARHGRRYWRGGLDPELLQKTRHSISWD
jgi:hypothetical protein